MADLRRVDRQLFPLRDNASVVQLFKDHLENTSEPDLALLSIVTGAVENSLTVDRSLTVLKSASSNPNDFAVGFELPLHIVDALYAKFHAIMFGSVDLSQYGNCKYATRELVKKVSDVVWNTLSRSYYKDRAHLQSLYSFLTGSKLDCFGVALAVVAGCQVLGYNDVHLALSEDHAWVVFGENSSETAEVTWHGKGNEDKRGQPIGTSLGSRSWLYVNGRPVICDRHMEVAALVSSINPSLNVTCEAKEVAELQKSLLWLLYDKGHLEKYPMALGNLGELEEMSPTPGRQPCFELFVQSVRSARQYYGNQHVYPYTYLGGYFFRHKLYKLAFAGWADAADVIRQYNYSRDDEELYKELMEIANDLIPHVMKAVGSGHSAHSILKDPECFAHLLRIYDGICRWEEDSVTPVLHIGWVKPLVNTIAKFDASVRAQLVIDPVDTDSEEPTSTEEEKIPVVQNVEPTSSTLKTEKCDAPKHENSGETLNINNNNYCKPEDGDALASDSGAALHPSIKALAAACSEKILNPEFLLQGGGEPFVAASKDDLAVTLKTADVDDVSRLSSFSMTTSNGRVDAGPSHQPTVPEPVKHSPPVQPLAPIPAGLSHTEEGRPRLALTSSKMRGLKDLLLNEKLNTQAISLQLTAQSQVQVGRKGRPGPHEVATGSRPKRTRRE